MTEKAFVAALEEEAAAGAAIISLAGEHELPPFKGLHKGRSNTMTLPCGLSSLGVTTLEAASEPANLLALVAGGSSSSSMVADTRFLGEMMLGRWLDVNQILLHGSISEAAMLLTQRLGVDSSC